MNKLALFILSFSLISLQLSAQKSKSKTPTALTATTAAQRLEGYQLRKTLEDNSLVKNLSFLHVFLWPTPPADCGTVIITEYLLNPCFSKKQP
jgi:hypothetical protein